MKIAVCRLGKACFRDGDVFRICVQSMQQSMASFLYSMDLFNERMEEGKFTQYETR